jgi:hypothetical protein
MKLTKGIALFLLVSPLNFAQLTQSEKLTDFLQVVGLYAKNYAPYQEKKAVYGFDLYDIQPWINQIQQSTTDLDFYDICVRYVASLRDFHDEFILLSNYDAWLHFNGDIYDGKFLIDFIDTSYPATSGLNIGDQLVSVDGVAVADLLTKFVPYSVNGASNPVSQQRIAAGTITERYQGWYPGAINIKTNAIVVVNQKGKNVSYTIPWDVNGIPLTEEGPVGAPIANLSGAVANNVRPRGAIFRKGEAVSLANPRPSSKPWGVWTGPRPLHIEKTQTGNVKPLKRLANMKALTPPWVTSGLSPFGNPAPVFMSALPTSFKQRLGQGPTDEFFSGTLQAGSLNIGFIRIPSMAPLDGTNAVNQFASEIAYFQANTDGLVVDVMGNGGGDGCYTTTLATYLIPQRFRGLGADIRATLSWQLAFEDNLLFDEIFGAPQYDIELDQANLMAVQKALAAPRGNTGPLPLCGSTLTTYPATDQNGNNAAYTKPILTLIDNFTGSAAEIFAMFLQDNKRSQLFGTRTSGGGGNVVEFDYNVGTYSEGSARVTESLITRLAPVETPGFPLLPSYDGVGIYPDIVQDYMTATDLATGGQPFVSAFTSAISGLIQKK